MSAFIRNFEIIPVIGSDIVDVDLGISTIPLSGVVNFVSFPSLTSFKIKNGAFQFFENMKSCSGLNVFDLSDGVITLSTLISCLSVFSDRKAITPELTGNVYLSGINMPLLPQNTEDGTPEYEFVRLYKFLTDIPNPWRVVVNKQPSYFYPANDQTLSIVTTGTNSAYVIVSSTVSAFNFRVNNYDGIYVNTYYNISALSGCYLTLTGTPQVTALSNILYAGQNTTLSAIDGSLHTFYYFNTGSFILGVSPEALPLTPLLSIPVTTVIPAVRYTVPSRYGYIDGNIKKSFNVNTLNNQTTYVILNTATNLFSLKINDSSVLSARNLFFRTTAGVLTSSYIAITGFNNIQPSACNLRLLSTARLIGSLSSINLPGISSVAYNLKYFYGSNRITLGIAQTGIEIYEPSNYYDDILIKTAAPTQEIFTPPTALPDTSSPEPSGGSIQILAPEITSGTRATTVSGSSFTYQIVAKNTPTSFRAEGLPTGLSISTVTGVINGVVNNVGIYTIELFATNSAGSGSMTLTLDVQSVPPTLPPTITSGPSAVGFVDVPVAYQIIATRSAYNYAATNLPPGLRVNSYSGQIEGLPTLSGTYTSTIFASNIVGTVSKTLTLNISGSPLPVITSTLTAVGSASEPFIYAVQGLNLDIPYEPLFFTATNLPSGLSINPYVGLISGTPVQVGTFISNITIQNRYGSDTETLTIAITSLE